MKKDKNEKRQKCKKTKMDDEQNGSGTAQGFTKFN